MCSTSLPPLSVLQVLSSPLPLSPAPGSKGSKDSKDGSLLGPGLALLPLTRVPKNIETLMCELCNGGHHEEKIILCDSCDKGYHMFCLSPPLVDVPNGEWNCPRCKAKDTDDFAFQAGAEITFPEFRKQASRFKSGFFGGESKAKKVGMFRTQVCMGRLSSLRLESCFDSVDNISPQVLSLGRNIS